MTDDVTVIRSLADEEWPEVTRLLTRAFIDEPYVIGLYGTDRLGRYEPLLRRFDSKRPNADAVVLGAAIEADVVGVAVFWLPQSCPPCGEPEQPPADPDEFVDWEFYRSVRELHLPQGPHGWVTLVSVEPALRGAGIGESLVHAGIDALRSRGVGTALLECEQHRSAFYERCGFRRVGEVHDPATNESVVLMRVG